MDDEVFGCYLITIAAADDIYCQVTGYKEWETRPNMYRIK